MAKTKLSKDEIEEVLSTFEFHGVDTATRKQGHVVTECPVCNREDHFYIRANNSSDKGGPGSCDCKVCGTIGNRYSFLQWFYQHHLNSTSDRAYTALAKHRKEKGQGVLNQLPPSAYKALSLAWDSDRERWLLPVFNPKGGMVDLKAYSPNASKPYPCSTSGCKSHLYNSQELNERFLPQKEIIVVCEGEWDVVAFTYLLSKLPKGFGINPKHFAIVGSSAGNIPDYEIDLLSGKQVWLLYDNDDAGRNGIQRAVQKLQALKNPPSSIEYIQWPESYPEKYDIFDLICNSNSKHTHLWEEIVGMLVEAEGPTVVEKPGLPELKRTKFTQVVADFKKSKVSMTQPMIDALGFAFATVISSRELGDPAWGYLVAQSGGGKSLILDSFRFHEQCVYRGKIGLKDVVSGYDMKDEDIDPSLLSELTDPQRCLLIKDYTGVLSLPHYEISQLYGVLREAYDGSYVKGYGNNIKRVYEGYFGILAGVTPKIHRLNDSDVGERFLKFILHGKSNSQTTLHILRSAIKGARDSADSAENVRLRQGSVNAFLDHVMSQDRRGVLTEATENRIIYLAQFAAMCRAKVERDRDGAVMYEAQPEMATRIAKQLNKLGQSWTLLLGLSRSNAYVSDILAKIGWDTAYSHKRSVLWYIYTNPSGVDRAKVMAETRLPSTSAHRVLDDLFELGAVNRKRVSTDKRGRPTYNYTLTKEMKEIIKKSRFK